MVVDSTNSAASLTTTSRILVGVHVGQLEVFDNHCGPCIHSSGNFNCCVDIPLVRRSAGLSVEGVKDQLAGEKFCRTSVTRWCTKELEWLTLCSQWSTIWLSVHRCTGIRWSLTESEAWTNFATLVAVTAAISSSLGKVKTLMGATRLLDMTKEILLSLQR